MKYKGLLGVYELVKRLRAPDGCPWDRKQTNMSLKNDLIEETYEVVSAIEDGSDDGLKEELGDLLFLVLMHIRIKEEQGIFTLEDVTQGIIDKMIYRHPHVFGNVQFKNEEELLKNWEKSKKGKSINDFPVKQPALLALERLYSRLKRHNIELNEENVRILNAKDESLRKILEGAIELIRKNKSPEDELRAFIKRYISTME